VPRRKGKKRRQQRHWDNDSVDRLQERLAAIYAKAHEAEAKLERLQARDREILEEYRNRPYGGIANIAKSYGLSRSTVHRIVKRHGQDTTVEEHPQPNSELTAAAVPMTEPSAATDPGAPDDDLDDADEESPRASQQEYEALRKDHEDLRDEYSELLGAIEEWMRRLRQQATLYRTRNVTREGGSETDGSSAAARFLTDVAWNMETCIREIARWFA
jgi:hypothetical protein